MFEKLVCFLQDWNHFHKNQVNSVHLNATLTTSLEVKARKDERVQ